ncbi:MAG: hypothetical protein DRR06_04065 [Gammaproteobacteria bacterium]|nr:MAG: hypothetical protein DRR06_04065 [Gammaproteobacteria bacterium]RLA54977.1 MAG: hypothetical protein DRR42_00315 [Gammaproteobacteria bacterium]
MGTSIILSRPRVSSLLALLVILLASWGIYHAARIGFADAAAYKAKYQVKGWTRDNRLPTEVELDYALEQISTAMAWEPGNPQHINLKADILIYKSLLHWQDEQFSAITHEAVLLYRQSLMRRPGWPYTWARLALAKAYSAEFDEIFIEAIDKAVKLGPWEPTVHLILAEAGIYGWTYLNNFTRQQIIDNVHRGLRFNQAALDKTAVRYQKKDILCAYLPNDKHTQEFCGW